MSTPKGTRCIPFHLATGESVHIYSNAQSIVLQLRKDMPTEHDVVSPSFKVAVKLKPADALKIAGELLTAAGATMAHLFPNRLERLGAEFDRACFSVQSAERP